MAKRKDDEMPETASFFARRTESMDAAGIAELVQRRTETVFGRVNVEYIIERATLGITLAGGEDGGGEILAHASLLDYPVIGSGVEQCSWENWTSENFTSDIRASPMNTLFLHLFVAKKGFKQAAIAEILRISFVAVPLLQYIIITVAPDISLGPALQPHFSLWAVAEGLSSPPHHLAHVAHRYRHFPQLHTRPARVEDSDDLMTVFKEYSTEMTKQYGEYFLAELIESQNDHHKTIVAEVGGRGVGFISVTSEVDLSVLNQSFQLEPYHHLRHPAPLHQEDGLKSQSVLSVPASDHLHTSSANMMEGEVDQQPGPVVDGEEEKKQGEGSQSNLSSSSLAKLAQIAQMTSSKSRLSTQSRSKLATHSRTKASVSHTKPSASQTQTNPGPSDTKLVQSKTTVVESESKKGVESKTKEAVSKSKITTSKVGIAESKKAVSSSQPGDEQSVTTAASQSVGVTAIGSGSVAESQPQMKEEKSSLSEEKEKRNERLAGQSNVVAIQLFAIHDQYEMRSLDLLVAVFQSFPNHDFCILSLPQSVSHFPLLHHFTRVPHRVHSTLNNELYIFHKCSLLHSFLVRPAMTSDLPGVRDLMDSLEGREEVMSDVVRGVEGGRDTLSDGATPLSAVVAECAHQIVGVAIVRREEDLLYLRSHYSIEDYVYMNHHKPEEHGRLYHFLLSPAFSSLSKHFIKEVMRKCNMTCLYYPYHLSFLPSSPSHPHKSHTITTALVDMVPVRPRKQVKYPDRERLGINQPLPAVLDTNHVPFALYHFNRKLSLEPKMVINSRVVVVGASDTAISLLETLVLSPQFSFSNLTLISTCGLPSPSLPSSCCYWKQTLSLLGLPVWVHVIQASITAINREEKEVIVQRRREKEEEEEEEGEEEEGEEEGEEEEREMEEGVVPYDHLILTTGLQFNPPPLTTLSSDCGDAPVVYDTNDGLEVSEWAQKYLQPQEEIVVYGASIEAYTAIQSLLASGVDPTLITSLRPHPPSFLNNETVKERVQSSLEKTGVKLMIGGQLAEVMSGGIRIVRRGGGGGGEEEEEEGEDGFIECQGLICMEEKQVSNQMFTAVNDACLVYDNGLVIDTQHNTNDPAILAAGPLTKFSRSYHSNHWTHANFNSREVGQKLAVTLLSKLDPSSQEPSTTASTDDSLLLPTYTQPKAVYTILPGGLHYLHVQKPISSLSDQTVMREGEGEMVTDTDNGYFRIHVNQYRQIQTITVLSHLEFEVSNYLSLYGLHEKYLNNIVSRYSEGLISDLFLYLREPWSCALFHDRFPDLRDEVGEILSQQKPTQDDGSDGDGAEIRTIEERVRDLLNEQQIVSLDDQKEVLLSEFASSPVKPAVQQLFHRYLYYNHYHLPMYAHPDII